MSEIYTALVYGPAGTQGSKRMVENKKTGNMMMIESSKRFNSWRRKMIRSMESDKPSSPVDDAAYILIKVFVHRPKQHYESNGVSLRYDAPKFPKSGRDGDKTARAVLDASKKAGWVKDDARYADISVKRRYTMDKDDPERVEVSMCSLEICGENFIDEVEARVTAGHPIDSKDVPHIENSLFE